MLDVIIFLSLVSKLIRRLKFLIFLLYTFLKWCKFTKIQMNYCLIKSILINSTTKSIQNRKYIQCSDINFNYLQFLCTL